MQQISLFAGHFNQSPDTLGPEDIRAYQVYLTNEKKLAPSSILTAVAALRFLYKVSLRRDWTFEDVIPAPQKPQKLPVVLSPEEVLQFLECVGSNKHRAILTTCYAAGLRISEAVCVDHPRYRQARMVIRVDQGKGQKDRYVMLSPKLLQIPRDWWRSAKPKPWLFPGDILGQHISTDAVEQACQKARRPVSDSEANNPSQSEARIRGSFARIQRRCPHDSVAARPSQPGHHRQISANRHEQSVLDIQSARPAASPGSRSPGTGQASILLSGLMDRPKLEVADIFRYGAAYRGQYSASMSIAQRRVMTAIGSFERRLSAATSSDVCSPSAIRSKAILPDMVRCACNRDVQDARGLRRTASAMFLRCLGANRSPSRPKMASPGPTPLPKWADGLHCASGV